MTNYDSFIFMHIPKCAGTSFRKFIYTSSILSGLKKSELYIPGENGLGVRKNYSNLNFIEKYFWKNANYKIIAMHCQYGIDRYNTGLILPFYYTLLKNPIERFLSHYEYFYFKQGIDGLKNRSLDELSYNEKKLIILKRSNSLIKHLSNLDKNQKSIKQSDYIEAKKCLFNKFGAFGFVNEISNSIGQLKSKKPDWLTLSSTFPRLNENLNKQECHNKIHPTTLKMIENANHWDIKLYQEAKSEFERRKSADHSLNT